MDSSPSSKDLLTSLSVWLMQEIEMENESVYLRTKVFHLLGMSDAVQMNE